MGRRSKLTTEVKAETIERYLQGEDAIRLSQIYGFNKKSLWAWTRKYQKHGLLSV